jgi:hypothetical protein
MKNFLWLIYFSSLGIVSQVYGQFNFPSPPSSGKEARDSVKERRERIFSYYAGMPMSLVKASGKPDLHEFVQTSLSKLATRRDLSGVSEAILKENFLPWTPGTDISLFGKICKKIGDYDFILMGLLHIAYLDETSGRTLLTPPAREKLVTVLLSQRGSEIYQEFKLKHCLPVKIHDSENHILMIQTSKYLTNQLLRKMHPDDLTLQNEKNGLDEWFLGHLTNFLKNDFEELNSRPYQGHSITPIALLYSYAENLKVRTISQMVLDYLSSKLAVQSIGLRRYTPFRRRKEYRDPVVFTTADSAIFWYAFHAGNHDITDISKREGKPVELEDYLYVYAAVDSYEIPPFIQDLFYEKNNIFQKFNAKDPEIYFGSKSFLLTAGGRHRNVFGFFTGENNVWAVPTNIIPKSSGIGMNDVFRLDGPRNWNRRSNLCVQPNFACGTNLYVPKKFMGKGLKKGPWTFYQDMDFNLAVYEKNHMALWEVQGPGDFEGFQQKVLELNGVDFPSGQTNTYKTTDGHVIEFRWSEKKDMNPIVSYDQKKEEKDIRRWPFAVGDVVNSPEAGVLKIAYGANELILDFRDPLNPVRKLIKNPK